MNDYCAHCNLLVVKHDPNRMTIHRTVYHRYCFIAALRKRFAIKDANERTPEVEAKTA